MAIEKIKAICFFDTSVNFIKKLCFVMIDPCDENRETKTSSDYWDDSAKTQQGEQCEKMLDGLTKWLKVGQVTDALKATRGRYAWKVMIVSAKKHDT